ELVGRTIGSIDFLSRHGVVVVGLWRKRGFMRKELSKVQLKGGDLLVLCGDQKALDRLRDNPSFLLLLPFSARDTTLGRGGLAGAVRAVAVAVAALEVLPVTMAVLTGRGAMVAPGCLTPRQAYGAIETRIFVCSAGAIPLGRAMEQAGTAPLFAGWLAEAAG